MFPNCHVYVFTQSCESLGFAGGTIQIRRLGGMLLDCYCTPILSSHSPAKFYLQLGLKRDSH